MQTFTGRTDLPFAVDRLEGATTLLVTFPKLRAGRGKPPLGLRPRLEGIPGHRLYLGADEHKFVGPRRRLDGLHTAVELIRREAEALEIAPEQVICAGTSMGAVLGLMTGLTYGAGRIVAGAPAVRMGTAVTAFMSKENARGAKREAASFVELARIPGGDDAAGFLDRFIFDLARECAFSCRIDLVVSPHDYAYAAALDFADVARANPLLEVELHLREYERHGSVAEDFYPLLRDLLSQETA